MPRLSGETLRHHRLGHTIERIEWCDAYCCLTCDEWTEPECDDPDCDYCAARPEKPRDAFGPEAA